MMSAHLILEEALQGYPRRGLATVGQNPSFFRTSFQFWPVRSNASALFS